MGVSLYDKKLVRCVLDWGAVLLAAALLAGCQISPRRVVVNNPSPTPTPSVSPPVGGFPSPSPTPFPSPTPIPTPTAMATVTPATPVNTVTEFLYTAGPASSTIAAYRINRDGSLSPAPASSIGSSDAPRKLAALGGSLIAAGRTTVTVYAVDRATGSLQQTDSVFLNTLDDMVLDVPAALIYAASGEKIFAYRVDDGRLQPVMGSPYRVSTALQAETGLRAESLVLDPARNVLEVGFRVNPHGHPSATMLGLMHRNPDGSLEPGLAWAVSPGETPTLPPTFAGSAALDATGQFVYMADADSGQVFAYRFEAGRLTSLSPAAYPAGEHPVAAAVVAPP